ncbi:hypothetical protein QJS04_geneDACA015458 [Acorus gramineus]|uniref:Uncharacterized protein n=1 Tax=Acorus gramineus TaxID=55184 RepID=A0AAV9A479_ACOGR|nr:hypothetical protein QJS04_geneDACA015458 [Acorus gramineus]
MELLKRSFYFKVELISYEEAVLHHPLHLRRIHLPAKKKLCYATRSQKDFKPQSKKACKRKKKQQQQLEQLLPFTKIQIASHCSMH